MGRGRLKTFQKLEALARHTSKDDFDKQILISLDEGDGWLHKYIKREKKQSSTIRSDLVIKAFQQELQPLR